jgi:hypothetical protein
MDAAKEYLWKWWGGSSESTKPPQTNQQQAPPPAPKPAEDDPFAMIQNKKLTHAERFADSIF